MGVWGVIFCSFLRKSHLYKHHILCFLLSVRSWNFQNVALFCQSNFFDLLKTSLYAKSMYCKACNVYQTVVYLLQIVTTMYVRSGQNLGNISSFHSYLNEKKNLPLLSGSLCWGGKLLKSHYLHSFTSSVPL